MSLTQNIRDNTFVAVANKHHAALREYLASHLQKEQHGISPQRQSARDKLTKLNASQFHELSTDVYDEMNRRQIPGNENGEVKAFLEVNDAFHQKRNQARQKLATLSVNRFKDLASDVHSELERRYTQLSQQQQPAQLQQKPLPPAKTSNPLLDDLSPVREDPPLPKSIETTIKDKDQKEPSNSFKDVSNLVNFASLDNLMADLGTMITTPSPLNESKTIEKVLDQKESVKQTASVPLSIAVPEDKNKVHKTQSVAKDMTLNKVDNQQDQKLTENYKKEIAQLNSKMEELKLQKDQSTKEHKQKLSDLEQKLSTSQQKEKELNQSLQEYKKKQSDLEVQINQQSQRLKEIQDKLTQNEATIKGLKTELAQKESDLKEKNSTLKSLNEKIVLFQTEKENLHKAVDAKDATLLSLSDEVEELNIKLADMQKNQANAKKEDILNVIDLNDLSIVEPTGKLLMVDIYQLKLDLKDVIQNSQSRDSTGTHKSCQDFSETVALIVETIGKCISQDSSLSAIKGQINENSKKIIQSAESLSLEDQKIKPEQSSHKKLLDQTVGIFLESLFKAVKILKVGFGNGDGSQPVSPVTPSDDKKAASPQLKLNQQKISPAQISPVEKVKEISELRVFLEKQTDLIVQNIQQLLQVMRSATFGSEFTDIINKISVVVDNLIQQSGLTLSKYCEETQQMKGFEIVNHLKNSNSRLEELGRQTIHEQQQGTSKPSKQKIASAAYEVAKYTKELVTLFEVDE